MRRFILITEENMIDGVEMEPLGSIALNWDAEYEYNVACESYNDMEKLRWHYPTCPILWLDTTHVTATQQQRERAREIRRQWLNDEYKVDLQETSV